VVGESFGRWQRRRRRRGRGDSEDREGEGEGIEDGGDGGDLPAAAADGAEPKLTAAKLARATT
jgi:hypothetical protein